MTKIRLGDQNLNDNVHDNNEYEIQKFIPHPDYGNRGIAHDLVIVQTKTKIRFNERIKPICIPTLPYNQPNHYAGEEVKFAGWGRYEAGSGFSNELREANFKVLTESECISTDLYHRRSAFKDLFFCAGNEVVKVF